MLIKLSNCVVPGSVLENSTFYILNYTLYNISIGYKIPVRALVNMSCNSPISGDIGVYW